MRNKEGLINLINKYVIYGSNQELKNTVGAKLVNEGRFTQSEYLEFFIHAENLLQLLPEELCWFAEAMESFKINGKPICITSDYFEKFEIDMAKMYVRKTENINKLLTFELLKEQAPNQYLCAASVKQIGLLKKYGLIKAVPEVQRQSKEIKIGNEILRRIHVNWDRVNDIANCLADDTFYYNEIRFNLDNDGIHYPIINKDKTTLTIEKDGFIIIPDGNHRTIACERALSDNPDKAELFENRFFGILLTFYPMTKVKEIVAQEWNRENVNKKHQLAMQRSNANLITEIIQFNSEADKRYANKIVTTGNEVKSNNGFIIKSMLSDAIEKYYKTNDKKYDSPIVRRDLANWLIEFFNVLTNILSDDFMNFQKIKKDKYTVRPVTWFGYVYLSAYLKNHDDWETKLVEIINSIDFSNDKYPKTITNEKTLIKTIEKVFEEVVTNVGLQKN